MEEGGKANVIYMKLAKMRGRVLDARSAMETDAGNAHDDELDGKHILFLVTPP
jgi:hypothetical protein